MCSVAYFLEHSVFIYEVFRTVLDVNQLLKA